MNLKQITLLLSAFLVCVPAVAEEIHFINGDTLDVMLIKQSSSTITFSHPALGEITINKVKISNLQSLNLDHLKKDIQAPEQKTDVAVTDIVAVDDAQFEAEIKAAEVQVIAAKESVDIAHQQLKIAEISAQAAEVEYIDVTGHAVKIATANVKSAEAALVAAVDNIDAIRENTVVAKKVNAANRELTAAREEVKVAQTELLAASEAVRVAKKDVRIAQKAGGDKMEESIFVAKEKVEVADASVQLAEEEVTTAEEKVQVAEDNVKLANGEKVNNGFMGTGWFKDWDSSIELGLRGSSGSSVNANFRGAINTRYEDADHRWDFKSFYLSASEDNISSENRVNALLVKDWFFVDTKWFAFASTMYDWDEFKDFDHRVQISVGPGYQFIKTEEWELSGRVAGTGLFEFDKTQFDAVGNPIIDANGKVEKKDVLGFEAMIGGDLTWHITAKQHFTLSNYFYPSLTDSGAFRNLTNITWLHSIDWFEGLAIKFGIRNEYDTSESIKNDFNYNFSLLWGF